MGIICPLSPEVRVINSKNKQLQAIVTSSVDGLEQYGFSEVAIKAVNEMQLRYMYNTGILQDIEKLHNYGLLSGSRQTENSISQTVQEQLQNSCLIMQNQLEDLQQQQKPIQGIQNYDSFQHNLKNNKSLVGIINILYRREIRMQQYSQSLQFFLKWANIFQQHAFGGFLKPIYKTFYQHLKTFPKNEFTSIVDQVCVFVQFMVSIITEIYGLKSLAEMQIGKLVKNENVYNLVMSLLFKKFKIKKFLVECIRHNNQDKIDRFQKQLKLFENKPTFYFGISKKFTLYDTSMTQSEISRNIEFKKYVPPYEQSLKLVDQLCNSGSPVTKLKIIIAISKRIMKDIEQYYKQKSKQVPELDPDNLSSIVMYLLAKTGKKNVFEQLKLVQHFTTTNCLNCISGYYLNVFIASIESLLQLQEKEIN